MPNEFIINHLPNNNIEIEGEKFHFFSGTSYLGMNQDPDFENLLLEGIRQYGTSFGSSRNGNLQLDIYQQAEEKLSRWVGSEAALTLSSGMLAGQTVANYFNYPLESRNAHFFFAPQTHAANLPTPTTNLPNISFQAWAEGIVEQINESFSERNIIICNSLDALRCTPYHFDWVAELPDNQEITLIIDDSHGLGITGKNGSGIFGEIKHKPNLELVVVSSLHKAMGIAGGVVFGKQATIDKLRHTAYFSSCSPIAPAYLYAYMNADEIYGRNQKKLAQNIKLFHSKLTDNQLFSTYSSYPVFYTENDSLFDFLYQNKIFIYRFSYPIKTAKPNTRIVLSAWHQPYQIELLAQKSNEFLNP